MIPSRRLLLIIGLCALQLCSSISFRPEELTEATHLTVYNEHANQRSLQDNPTFSEEYSVPFQVIWNMAFSDDTVIQEPNQQELTGLFYATLVWIRDSTRDYYKDQSAVMVLDRMEFTHYGASFNATSDYPSTVGMECACYFKADSPQVIPSVFEYLVAFSGGFNRTSFLENYLANADPDDNIYRTVTGLRYNIVPSSIDRTEPEIFGLALNTEWVYEIGYGIPDRQPTNPEYLGLQEAHNKWLVDLFTDAYPPNPLGNPEFHLLESNIYSISFNPQEKAAHTIRSLSQVSFRQPAGGGTLGITQQDLLEILELANLKKYRNQYLHWATPALSLFRGVVDMTWTSLDGE